DVHGGLELQSRQHGREHVGEFQWRMLRKHMASTGLAPFAVAHRGLVVGADVIGTLGDLDRRRLPEAERVDRARGPVTARLAMAVPHGDRLAAHRELDGTAKAATFVFTHSASPSKAEQIDPDRQPGQGACSACAWRASIGSSLRPATRTRNMRSEEHTSELQSRGHLVCRLLLEKKKRTT